MTTTPPGAIRPKFPTKIRLDPTQPDLASVLASIGASYCLIEAIQLGFTPAADAAQHLDIVRDSLGRALQDLGGALSSIPTEAEIEGATIDEADAYLSSFEAAEIPPMVSWSNTKDLIRRGIEAGIRLAGGAK